MRQAGLIAAVLALLVGTAISDIKTVGFGKVRSADAIVGSAVVAVTSFTPQTIVNPQHRFGVPHHSALTWHAGPQGSTMRLTVAGGLGTHAAIGLGPAGQPPIVLLDVIPTGRDGAEIAYDLDPKTTRILDGQLTVTVVHLRIDAPAPTPMLGGIQQG